jgi:hypothetical protein
VVGEGAVLFGDDGRSGARSRAGEPLRTLTRSARSRVSLVAPLDVACEDNPLASPIEIFNGALLLASARVRQSGNFHGDAELRSARSRAWVSRASATNECVV